ncbi:hypothetical protein KIN20_013156 [Parelaphostrongylus tenuis]|uniref:Uncharacterized protein n=1 Tax=Parelaphostrongylus tenuis TaxID=148309 RepID=A0AAD5QMF0_PARTN|nr:hypothetical protein KIN20_013156 [Parelaphostrongylus tenuis]
MLGISHISQMKERTEVPIYFDDHESRCCSCRKVIENFHPLFNRTKLPNKDLILGLRFTQWDSNRHGYKDLLRRNSDCERATRIIPASIGCKQTGMTNV